MHWVPYWILVNFLYEVKWKQGKGIQSLKSASSIWFHSLYPRTYSLSMGIIIRMLNEHIHAHYTLVTNDKSSHRICSINKGFLKNLAKFTRKHLFWSLFFNKVAGPRPVTLFKKRLQNPCFPIEVLKNTLKNTFFNRTLPVAASEMN